MYILSGKGSVAGIDLANAILKLCQNKGILWDNDLPEYTLDFATQIPSISKSIRDGDSKIAIDKINFKLKHAEQNHSEYMILCLTAHKLIQNLQTEMRCINLWSHINKTIENIHEPIAFLGTPESLDEGNKRFLLIPHHADAIGDLITSVKRGYADLGINYAAHPIHLLRDIVSHFKNLGVRKYFLACTDLQICRDYLVELGIARDDIISVIDIAASAVVARSGRTYDRDFLDSVSDARTHLRYKYLSTSDAPQTDKKTQHLEYLLSTIKYQNVDNIRILDIGGSSTGHSLRLAKFLNANSCHITLLDISAASLNAAKCMHEGAEKIKTEYVNASIEDYESSLNFDAVLCIGVLLYISKDSIFEKIIKKISNLIKPNGILITRDCLHDNAEKKYMNFGGVIRNRTIYESNFINSGLDIIETNEFIIEEPIRRNIVSTVWRKQ